LNESQYIIRGGLFYFFQNIDGLSDTKTLTATIFFSITGQQLLMESFSFMQEQNVNRVWQKI